MHLKNATRAVISQISSNKNDFIEAVFRYVEDHIEEHISLSNVAEYVNLSPSYLSSCFSKVCGQSLINYVNARKMDYACQLLGENNALIYEVSYRLGFNNAYYFTKMFKRHIGMTPLEYQNVHKEQEV